MAIPKSTIVMALVVCVPFGFAVRSSLQESDDDDSSEELEKFGAEQEAIAEAEARARAQAEEREAEEFEKRAREAVRGLYGAEPATLGTAFSNIKLGASEDAFTAPTLDGVSIDPTFEHGRLASVSITPDDCAPLAQQLTKAWGLGASTDVARHWIHPLLHQRATLGEADDCVLELEPYVDPAQWINKSKTSTVPLWALGMTRDKLLRTLGNRELDQAEDEISWTETGLGYGEGYTSIIAVFENNKVVTVIAMSKSAEVTRDALEEHLTTLYGQPTGDAELRWAKKPPIQLQRLDGYSVYVTAGKPEE